LFDRIPQCGVAVCSQLPAFFLDVIQADGRVKIVKRLSGAVPFDQFNAAVDTAIATAVFAGRSN
jgi:hypothetical protein